MTKDEIIKKLRDMAKYPTVTIPRDSEALKEAADLLAQPERDYEHGFVDGMQKQMQSSVDKAVNRMAQPEHKPKRWAVYCSECRKEWSVSYPHSGKSICAECDAKIGAQPEQEPVAWINWCAATGKRTVSFECESELASQPLYEGITQNTQYHYSKFHSWFDSELHRQKYTKDHPAYLAAQEAWNAANDAAQHRINRLNAEIEAWKVRFKIAEDALVKLNGPEQKPVATMWQHGETGRTRITMPGDITDCDARWFKVSDLYTVPQHQTPLTDDEIHDIYDEVAKREPYNMAITRRNIARAIEAKLKEKNT